MCKYYASEVAVKASGLAVQLLGAAGYMEDHPVEQFYRDARQLTIVEGTSQVQLGLIARGRARARPVVGLRTLPRGALPTLAS
jgi:alkylation response protein AidB-like acyl-CoA dehydrogenase